MSKTTGNIINQLTYRCFFNWRFGCYYCILSNYDL